MRLYTTPSGAWFGTQADARRIAREFNTSWVETNVPTDKEGLLSFLNTYNVVVYDRPLAIGQPDLGIPAELPAEEAPKSPPVASYTHQSVTFDEAWEGMSLSRKLHFAALAMEDARAQL